MLTIIYKDIVKVLILMGVLLVIWVIGLAAFIHQIPEHPGHNLPKVDAIIILTGGAKRLEEGLKLYEKTDAKKILISGVGKGFSKQSLATTLKRNEGLSLNNIYLGELANSTSTNAMEAKVFMELNQYSSMLLVTSNYHIYRSNVAFTREMPGIKIYSYPVCSDNFTKKEGIISWPSLKLAANEYNKLILFMLCNSYFDLCQASDKLNYELIRYWNKN